MTALSKLLGSLRAFRWGFASLSSSNASFLVELPNQLFHQKDTNHVLTFDHDHRHRIGPQLVDCVDTSTPKNEPGKHGPTRTRVCLAVVYVALYKGYSTIQTWKMGDAERPAGERDPSTSGRQLPEHLELVASETFNTKEYQLRQ